MGSGASLPQDKHIVIVGAGYGGNALASALLKANANFTIINARDYMYHNIGGVRSLVEPGWAKKTFIPLEPMYGDHLKVGNVVDIKHGEKKVVLSSGEEVAYDVLVIATGTGGDFPSKVGPQPKEESIQQYDALLEKVQGSEHIVIIGGGATGVEIAAEVATKYPNKKVTLLHSRETLVMPELNDNFQKKLRKILERMKINLVLGEKVLNLDDIPVDGPATVTTDKGTSLEADIVIKCIGLRVNTEAYKNNLGDAMEQNGSLKVNEFLQVEGHEDIFAIGDCTNTKEPKLAYLAGEQAKLMASNLKQKMSGGQMKAYKPANAPVVCVLALGPNSGLGQTKGGTVLGEFICKTLKSRDLLINRYWKELNQTPPK